ncbi:UDP-glucuronosyltransferase [Sergentomyia squamirostris]
MKYPVIIGFVLGVLCCRDTAGYNILGIFHTPGKSHHILAGKLVEALAEAGHTVTIVAPHKLSKPVKNIKEIVLNVESATKLSKNLYEQPDSSVNEQLQTVIGLALNFTDNALSDPEMKALIRSKEKFDVIIVEIFLSESLMGLGKVFNAPMIGFTSFGPSKWSTDLNGSPSPLSYVPHVLFTYTDRMTFGQRLANTMISVFEKVYMDLAYNHRQEALYNKHFPDPKPNLDELKKTSFPLILLNSHFSLSYPRPLLPNMIEIGGFHVDKKPKPLPQDLQKFLDSETNGVIYFSMGSTLQSSDLPAEKRTALLRTFSKLPMKVMWKWEDDSLPGKPDNVLIRKWFPQNDILAHPNVKLFITHGGLLSTMEATWFGVPVVGIPIYGDQMMNMGKTQASGYGLTVVYANLTEESLHWAVNEVLTNEKYSRKAKAISSRFRDQESDPMERAIYWIEYVARHGGARHLVSGAQDLHFIQYHNLDVFAFLILVPVLLLLTLKWIIKKLFCKTPRKQDLKKKHK